MDKIITVKDKNDYDKLNEAAKALARGQLVAFPTETVYGLGANALDEQAVKSIFKAKGRPQDNPLIVHVAKKEDIEDLVKEITSDAKKIIDALMPGAITIILKKSNIIPDAVTAGGETVAIRMPSSPVARELIMRAGVPVAAPSANRSGKPSPTKAAHVKEDLEDEVFCIIDGGDCAYGLESTVLDLTCKVPTILRPGGVTYEELTGILDKVVGSSGEYDDKKAPKSPGMKYRHYAPSAQMSVFLGEDCDEEINKEILKNTNKKIFVLLAEEKSFENAETIVLGKTAMEYSQNLFDALRNADNMGADIILAHVPFSSGGIATALLNRIYKSCGGNVKICR